MAAWHTNKPGYLSLDAWRWKAKSHCHCYHISQLQEALPWHIGEYGLILIPAYVWMCFHERGQSGLMEFSGAGYKAYKSCCVCGIHMNNFSEGKPCLKARTNFHSKGSIAFSATLSKRWPHTSLDFRASNNHNPAKPKAMPGWSSVAHEDQECPRGIGLFQPWDYPAGGTYKMSSSSRCSPLNASMSWSI